MIDICAKFDGQQANEKRLISFGFGKEACRYVYSVKLMDGQFKMTVCISDKFKVSAEVVDCETSDSYVLVKIADANGGFVGKVRSQYEKVLMEIFEKCFSKNVFKSDCAKQVINYIEEKYGDKIEFLWPKFASNAIFRRRDTAKWYVVLLTVTKRKLGMEQDGDVEIIDFRIAPTKLIELVDGDKYILGYHMNKKHWVTTCLDGSVELEDIFKLIDDSYIIASK